MPSIYIFNRSAEARVVKFKYYQSELFALRRATSAYVCVYGPCSMRQRPFLRHVDSLRYVLCASLYRLVSPKHSKDGTH